MYGLCISVCCYCQAVCIISTSTRFAFVLDERWHGNYIPFASRFLSFDPSCLALSLTLFHPVIKTQFSVVSDMCLCWNTILIIYGDAVPHAHQLITEIYAVSHKTRENSHPFSVAHFIAVVVIAVYICKDQHPLYRCPICCTYTHAYVRDSSFADGCCCCSQSLPYLFSIYLNTHNKSNNWIKTAHGIQ